MRMKNRYCRMGKALLAAMCLLSTCGITYSCSDDYDLPDTKPGFLGGSIYDELKTRNFNTVVRLIDDLGYADVLSKTGSKTLFAASDSAYQQFFATTTWTDGAGNPIRSYEQLSQAQKAHLLNNAMLNNPYVLEMLSNTEGGGKDLCLRQGTQASGVDSVTCFRWDELPHSLAATATSDVPQSVTIGGVDFWAFYRNQARGHMYVANDGTNPMLTHFLEGNMNYRNVKRSDITFILNLPVDSWKDADGENQGAGYENRSYVYDARIIQSDITCMNGYIHVLDKVLVTPPNMAEVIRQNPNMQMFSHILDRFSIPVYNPSLTKSYAALHDIGLDSVYSKHYVSERSVGATPITSYKQGASITTQSLPSNYPSLPYDPAWNTYMINVNTPATQDMGAMFVPSDDALEDYFLRGGGRVVLENYATIPFAQINRSNLDEQLYQIPLNIIAALVRNLMKDSFNESVPSKYLTIMNDAQDQMFQQYSSEAEYRSKFNGVQLANNGVVYEMNTVVPPADYAAVLAPVLQSPDTKVVNAVLTADDAFVQGGGFASAPLQRYYSTYLKAMQARFSFFVPTDEALGKWGLVDPMSLAYAQQFKNLYQYWTYQYSAPTGAVVAVSSKSYHYNPETGQVPGEDSPMTGTTATSKPQDAVNGSSKTAGTIKRAMLIEMMDQHIVVHDNNDFDGVNGTRNYYTSRTGAPVTILQKGNMALEGEGMRVMGGMQMDIRDALLASGENPTPERISGKVLHGYNLLPTEANGEYGNGRTYFIDRAIQPTTKTIFYRLKNNPEFSEFYNLCDFAFDDAELELMGFRDSTLNASQWSQEAGKYKIYSSDMNCNAGDKLIRFLNNYRYTLYVPSNEAILKAIADGLPTYTQIEQFVEANTQTDADGNKTMAPEAQAKARAMVTLLVNFIRYHFQDEAIYVDNVDHTESYQTACIDNVDNLFIQLTAKQQPGKITVVDASGRSVQVDPQKCNVLARDAEFNGAVQNRQAYNIKQSSYVSIHRLNGVLNFDKNFDGQNYRTLYESPAKARAFAQRFRIKE